MILQTIARIISIQINTHIERIKDIWVNLFSKSVIEFCRNSYYEKHEKHQEFRAFRFLVVNLQPNPLECQFLWWVFD